MIAAMIACRSGWIRQPASFYVWLFRGMPVLVQLIDDYTGLPQLGIQLAWLPRR